MAKYYNPGISPVTLDLGNPSRRHIRVVPLVSPAAEGVCRIIEMDPKKAAFFMSINLLSPLDSSLHPSAVADVNVADLEQEATAAAAARYNRKVDPSAVLAEKTRREAAEAEFRAKEAEELAVAEAALKRQEEIAAVHAQRAEDAKGIIATQAPIAPELVPDAAAPAVPPAPAPAATSPQAATTVTNAPPVVVPTPPKTAPAKPAGSIMDSVRKALNLT